MTALAEREPPPAAGAPRRRLPAPSPVAGIVIAVAAVVLHYGSIGGDARWVAALGAAVARSGGVPDGVPYAIVDSSGWHNVPVLAEVLAHLAFDARGSAALVTAQAAAVAACFLVLARDAVAGGAGRSAAAVLLAVAAWGTATSLLVVRLQVFSLLLFPVLVALLRADDRRPGRTVWLVPPLLALWSNLHGAVLVGFAVTGSYLLLRVARDSPRRAVTALLACSAAMLATPAGLHTITYYREVAANASADMHVGLWARLSPTSPFDQLLALTVLALGPLALRARPPAWEWAAIAGLSLGTLLAARSGVWLVLFLVPAAARALVLPPGRVEVVIRYALAGAAVLGLVAASTRTSFDPVLASEAVQQGVLASTRCVVAAEGPLGEAVAVIGGRVWLTNPLDAFPPDEQDRFVLWSAKGDVRHLPDQVTAALVISGSRAADALERAPGWSVRSRDASATLLVHRSCT